MSNARRVLVDTNVLLEDPDVLVRIRQRGGLPFLTSTVLDELDFNKDVKKRVNKPSNKIDASRVAENARNAQLIFREFTSSASTRLAEMPNGGGLVEGDNLVSFCFKDGPTFVVGREEFKSKSNNDAKIIELAKDYEMILITRDKGMKVRAETLGVEVALWTGPEEARQRQEAPNKRMPMQRKPGNSLRGEAVTNGLKPFGIFTSPRKESDVPLQISKIPEAGDLVKLGGGHEFHLGSLISAGGEGSIFETPMAGQVCKIYHRDRLTSLKKRKIELMVSRRIDRAGICWPTELVTDQSGEFVGYLMPRASGSTIQKAMFVKPVLEKTFPKWRRRDLVNVAGTFVDHINYLHSLNIIVGDINPLNFLVTEDSTRLWMVDTDSFQIEDFPCPVGTINFTPPEIQGINYAEFLRTRDHELFAVATMIFMILCPGKPPYSQQGGGTPSDNIRSKNFPYPFGGASAKIGQSTPTNAPQGTWQFIWGNLPYKVREAFYSTFREDKRASVDDWSDLLIEYRSQLEQGFQSDELFPLQFKIRDPVVVSCAECSTSFTSSQRFVEKLQADGKPVWCPECAQQIRLKRLAAKSRRETVETTFNTTTIGRRVTSFNAQPRRPSAQVPSWQRPGSTQGSSQGNRIGSKRSATTGGQGFLSSILKFIFK